MTHSLKDCVSMVYDLVGARGPVYALGAPGQCRLQVYIITFTHNDNEDLMVTRFCRQHLINLLADCFTSADIGGGGG